MTPQAVAKVGDLLARAQSNHSWCQTGGREGTPANFDGEDMRPLGDKLAGLRLTAMSAKGANMVSMNLTGVHLQGANLENADLRGVCFKSADLRGARLAGANLTKADLRDAVLAPLPLGNNRETPGSLHKARVRYAMAQDSDMTNAILDGADVRGCDFTGATMQGASLREVDLDTSIGFAADRAA